MKIEKVNIKEVFPNKENPRVIKDEKYQKLVKSINEFPQMLEIRPIVVNEDMVVLGGNMRLKACNEAGLKEVHIIRAGDLTNDQQKEFIIKDNVGFGEWDWDMIANEWEGSDLNEWGLDVWNPEEDVESIESIESTEINDLSDSLEIEYKIEVECVSEREQEELFNNFTKKGYKCRILTL